MKIKDLDKLCPKCNKWAMKWENNEFVCGNCGFEEKIGQIKSLDTHVFRGFPLISKYPCKVVKCSGEEEKAMLLGWGFGYEPFETEEHMMGVVKFENGKISVLKPEQIRFFDDDIGQYCFADVEGEDENVTDR